MLWVSELGRNWWLDVRIGASQLAAAAAACGEVKCYSECGLGRTFWNVDRKLTQRTLSTLSLVELVSPQSAVSDFGRMVSHDGESVKEQKNCAVLSNSDGNLDENSEVGSWVVSSTSSAGEEKLSSSSSSGNPSRLLMAISSLNLAPGQSGDILSSPDSEEAFRGSGNGGEEASTDASHPGDKSLPPTDDEDGKRVSGLVGVRTAPLSSSSPSSSSRRVAVIGAGGAGLVAARELVREGHAVVVYEQGEEVGGVWQYDPRVESDPLGTDPNRSRVHSSMYNSLRTNLPREIMGYLDYPFVPKKDGLGEGRDGRRFPDHREVAHYLEDFAKDFDLIGLVQFGVKVDYVGPEEETLKGAETRWIVRFQESSGDSKTKEQETHDINCQQQATSSTEIFDAVVVCNGHYAESRIVHIPGVESWPGIQMHSHNYRFPHPFQDKVVVVIGSANSAQDITSELALLAKEVHQCARAWTAIEASIEGKGPKHNIWQHPMVERACPDGTVVFQDGTSAVADIILFCTGYSFSFPFLDSKDCVSVVDNRVGPLYKHVFPPALAPTLSFVGLPWKVVPFQLMELQSRWIARIISGKSSLPTVSEMMVDIEDLYKQLEAKHVPISYTHNCAAYQFEYVDWLAEQSGHGPVETWRKEIYLTAGKNKLANPDTYRDEWEDQQLVEVALACLEKFKVPSKGLSKK